MWPWPIVHKLKLDAKFWMEGLTVLLETKDSIVHQINHQIQHTKNCGFTRHTSRWRYHIFAGWLLLVCMKNRKILVSCSVWEWWLTDKLFFLRRSLLANRRTKPTIIPCFSAPKLHTHDHAAILYTFVTLTTPTHQGASNSHGSLLTIARLDREKRFTARNGGPTRREDCFLGPFVQRRREMAHPAPTKSFSRPSPKAAMLPGPLSSNQELFKAKPKSGHAT